MVIAETIEARTIGITSRKVRIVYTITDKGLERFAKLNETVSAEAWQDDYFGVRFIFFTPTTTMNRVRILEARLRRLQSKADVLHDDLEKQ